MGATHSGKYCATLSPVIRFVRGMPSTGIVILKSSRCLVVDSEGIHFILKIINIIIDKKNIMQILLNHILPPFWFTHLFYRIPEHSSWHFRRVLIEKSS